MKVEIEVISKETIKPCSPTPNNLSHYSLSYLDQIVPPIFMPLIYFFPSSDKFSKTEFKKSLSIALTKFYPLAGRLVNNLYVNCNDEGVPYAEAKVNCKLSVFMSKPIDPNELNKFIPCELNDVQDIGVVVQVNFFQCGGIAIGIGISHKLADAASCFMFVNTWAAISRGEFKFPLPKFDSATLFPPKDMSSHNVHFEIPKDQKVVAKRFVFTNTKISNLIDKYSEFDVTSRRPSRILGLSAFLWSRYMSTVHAERDPTKFYAVIHTVNLRTRSDPPMSESLFGNIMRSTFVVPFFDKGSEDEVCKFMNNVREAMQGINSEFISQLQKNDQHLNVLEKRTYEKLKGQMELLSFSSLCKFPLYEADFGWGKPIWVGSARLALKDVIALMDTKSGDGIEAWVNLKAEDMAKFEVDKELLALCDNGI